MNVTVKAKCMTKNTESWSTLSAFKDTTHSTEAVTEKPTGCHHHHHWLQSTDWKTNINYTIDPPLSLGHFPHPQR